MPREPQCRDRRDARVRAVRPEPHTLEISGGGLVTDCPPTDRPQVRLQMRDELGPTEIIRQAAVSRQASALTSERPQGR
jgi:hypothetical protein